MFLTFLAIAVLALSAVSVGSARDRYLPIPQAKQSTPAKQHLKVEQKISKTGHSAYYHGTH